MTKESGRPTYKIYVGNLAPNTSDYDLVRVFSQYGEVIEAVSLGSKGFGFVVSSTLHSFGLAYSAVLSTLELFITLESVKRNWHLATIFYVKKMLSLMFEWCRDVVHSSSNFVDRCCAIAVVAHYCCKNSFLSIYPKFL